MDVACDGGMGPFAQHPFPDGQYIGDDRYMDFVQTAFGTSRAEFESQVKDDMESQRLQAMVTGGATVSDAAVREAYRVQGMKVQFDYAAVSLEDLKKTINPDLRAGGAFFEAERGEVRQGDSGDAQDRVCGV